MKKLFYLFILITSIGFFHQCSPTLLKSTDNSVAKKEIEFLIKPSSTDSVITIADVPHLIRYDASIPQGKLFLFLPGTNGIPERGPRKLFETAMQQGYRVINLSYINKQAVARICKGENLIVDSDCAEHFRTQRIYGVQNMSMIPDKSHDAIMNRFAKLLLYLKDFDKKGNWEMYLNNGEPDWSKVAVAGQSQGGGMAAFIAKRQLVDKVITFSGGWDYSGVDKIAKWYFNESITPSARWYGTYHVEEPKAATIAESYKAMAIPDEQIYPLDLKIREGKRAHGEAIRNIVYKEKWIEILGDGKFN